MGQAHTTRLAAVGDADDAWADSMSVVDGRAGTGPASPMPHFPPEVLNNMIDYLDYSTLRRCALVNSVFYGQIKRRLCRRVRLRISGTRGDPGFLTFEGEVVRAASSADDLSAGDVGGTSTATGFTTRWSKHWVKDYVRCLDIDAHEARCCASMDDGGHGLVAHDIRNTTDAIAIRINLSNTGGRALFHTDGDPQQPQQRCQAIDAWWKVRIMVFRNLPAYFRGVTGLFSTTLEWNVQHAVYLLGPLFLGAGGTVNDTLYLHTRASRGAADSTVVFTAMPGEPFSPMLPKHDAWDDTTAARWFERLLAALATSWFQAVEAAFPAHPELTVVNAGAVPVRFLGPAGAGLATRAQVAAHIENTLRHNLRVLLPKSAVDRYPKVKNGSGLRFRTMKGYLEDGMGYTLDGEMQAAWEVAEVDE